MCQIVFEDGTEIPLMAKNKLEAIILTTEVALFCNKNILYLLDEDGNVLMRYYKNW